MEVLFSREVSIHLTAFEEFRAVKKVGTLLRFYLTLIAEVFGDSKREKEVDPSVRCSYNQVGRFYLSYRKVKLNMEALLC